MELSFFKDSFRPAKEGPDGARTTMSDPDDDMVLLSADEQRIITFIEQTSGRKLTAQEINLSLEQARALGEL
jgi:hypothetical protein